MRERHVQTIDLPDNMTMPAASPEIFQQLGTLTRQLHDTLNMLGVLPNLQQTVDNLPDARSLPIAQIEELAGELDKYRDTPLILVCQSGSRSAAACKKLEKLGFARVHNLSGGVQAWSESGLPLRRGGRK